MHLISDTSGSLELYFPSKTYFSSFNDEPSLHVFELTEFLFVFYSDKGPWSIHEAEGESNLFLHPLVTNYKKSGWNLGDFLGS